jgi:hypothetical protein
VLPYDPEARRQLCRERVQELAREARLARGPAEYRAREKAGSRGPGRLLSLMAGLSRAGLRRAPAYRA